MKHMIRLVSLVFIAALLVLAIGVRSASAVISIFDTINRVDIPYSDRLEINGISSYTALAQSFQINIRGTEIKTISLNLQQLGAGTGLFNVEVWAKSGDHPNPFIVLKQLTPTIPATNDISGLGTDGDALVVFDNVNLSLDAGEYYVVVYSETGDLFAWGYDDTGSSTGAFSGGVSPYVTYKDFSYDPTLMTWQDGTFSQFPYRMVITANIPATAVSASGLDVKAVGSQSWTARWHTDSESDLVGFNLYTSATAESTRVKVNATLIPAKGSDLGGNAYEYTVAGNASGFYWLGVVSTSGETLVGPTPAMRYYYVPVVRR